LINHPGRSRREPRRCPFLIDVPAAPVERVRSRAVITAGDFHPQASTPGGEGFGSGNKFGADAVTA
jgi:hypothetical protein